jgi:hypothetical protein
MAKSGIRAMQRQPPAFRFAHAGYGAFSPHPFPIVSLPVFRCIYADDIKGVIIRHKKDSCEMM